MKILSIILTLVLLLQSWSRAQTVTPTPPVAIDFIHGIEIGRGGDKILHAELARPHELSATPTPAIIYVHGGGWSAGSETKFPTPLVRQGFITASIEYRLSGEAKWPAQIEDCKLGVRWLRANAAKYGVDPNRIGCWGVSAGGHLVACLGTMDSPALEGKGGYPGVSSKVQAVIDQSGPTDFTAGNFGTGSTTIDEAGLAHDVSLEEELLGATFAKNPNVYRQASPITWVHAGDPPFLIIHGENDKIVAPQQATTFASALEKAGVPVELLMVKNGTPKGHATLGGQPDPEGQLNAIVAFLRRHLAR
jgi:acetyl esterase/lipase